MRDLGKVSHFLGILFEQKRVEIKIKNLKKYILKILESLEWEIVNLDLPHFSKNDWRVPAMKLFMKNNSVILYIMSNSCHDVYQTRY